MQWFLPGTFNALITVVAYIIVY